MTMAKTNITIRIQIAPWVRPYVELMARLGCGNRCLVQIQEFVKANGLKVDR